MMPPPFQIPILVSLEKSHPSSSSAHPSIESTSPSSIPSSPSIYRPVKCDTEEVFNLEIEGVELVIDNRSFQKGSVFLSNRRACWISSAFPEACSLSLQYPVVGLHALCKDSESWPSPCFYAQLDTDLDISELLQSSSPDLQTSLLSSPDSPLLESRESEDDEGEDGSPKVHEFRLVPRDETSLASLFKVFSEMSALNPDAPGGDSEGDGSSMINNSPFGGGNLGVDSEWFTADNVHEWLPDEEDVSNCDDNWEGEDGMYDDPEEEEGEEGGAGDTNNVQSNNNSSNLGQDGRQNGTTNGHDINMH